MTAKASEAWKLLHGVICTYKPASCSSRYVVEKLQSNLCKDLNNLEIQPPRAYLDIDRSGSEISVSVRPSYADNVLCSGPKFNRSNVVAGIPDPLPDLASGVLGRVPVVCINGGNNISTVLQRLNFTRCYHIKGILGQATVTGHINEKVIAKANYKKVTESRFEKVLASYQCALQRRIFHEYGIHLQSQEAYDFAVSGLYRPGWKGAPITYSLKIIEFNPPDFTLELQSIHATQNYLTDLIHNVGVSLKSYATCSEIRCIRQGCFHVEHALTKRQWTLNDSLDNINLCWKILEENYPENVTHSRTVDTVKTEINFLNPKR